MYKRFTKKESPMENIRKRAGKVNEEMIGITGSESIGESIDIDVRVALIQDLIPLGLAAVNDLLQYEVRKLAGIRYSRADGDRAVVRWGKQGGSVYLGDQKVRVKVPRVRDRAANQEVELQTYKGLQEPQRFEETLLRRVLYGISCKRYSEAAQAIPGVFGLNSSSVSRRFIRASSKKLASFNERRLEKYEFVAIVIDGKTFADDQMIIAIGITITGEKILLGFIQSATENAASCAEFLKLLIDRGLYYEQGILCIIDGSKGIRKAIKEVFGNYAVVQRCQWHKRENVVSYLPKSKQAVFRKKFQQAYEQPTYEKASEALKQCKRELNLINKSAVASLEEGLEETLTLHKLGVFEELGISLKTTNCLESINAQISRLLKRITYWKNSDQKHRWLASALLAIEPRLNRIKGYNSLPKLQKAIQKELKIQKINVA
jgi:putative transposase